jgi:hypothetical protein
LPFIENTDPTNPTPKTSQDMMKELTSLSTSGKLYLDVGEMDEDKCIVKYAGYIQYQAEVLINQLASGETLGIQEYTTMVTRMNMLLSKLDSYLNGESLPECTADEEVKFEQDLDRQEIQDYIYNQNGVFSS